VLYFFVFTVEVKSLNRVERTGWWYHSGTTLYGA